jgi:hypothetical protein
MSTPGTLPVSRDAPLAQGSIRELLGFPAEHLPALPVQTRISLQGLGIAHPITWTTGPAAERSGEIAFGGEELRAIALGVQAERLWPSDLKGFCLRKLHDPSFRVTAQLTLDGAQPEPGPSWPLARVLRWLELELREVELDGVAIDPIALAATAGVAA